MTAYINKLNDKYYVKDTAHTELKIDNNNNKVVNLNMDFYRHVSNWKNGSLNGIYQGIVQSFDKNNNNDKAKMKVMKP